MKTILYRSLSQPLSQKTRCERGGGGGGERQEVREEEGERGVDYINTDYVCTLQTQTYKRPAFTTV